MKKLLITTMAAVSVGLCAKAEDTGFISGTSFETVPVGSYLATNGQTTVCKWFDEMGNVLSDSDSEDPEMGYRRYWVTEATDAQLVVSNLDMFADSYLLDADRPKAWSDEDNLTALYIDTDKPLMRYVNYSQDGKKCTGKDLNDNIFIDSVVQFTATDVAAEPDGLDKLRVWLYTSPDDVGTTPGLFGETTPKTCLVVTAGEYAGELSNSDCFPKHYEVEIAGVDMQPDTWHRLTIKAIADIDPTESATPGFEIWVDGKPVTYGVDKKTQFPSLKQAVATETLQCVAFDGKGAVDDIVFTTTTPEFAKEPEAATANVTITFDNLAAIADADNQGIVFTVGGDDNYITDLATDFVLNVGTSATLQFMLNEGFELVSPAITPSSDGVYTVTIDALTAEGATIAIVTKSVTGGGDEPGTEDPITTYAVSVTPNAQATVTVSSASYAEGDTVTFMVVAATGYTVKSVVVAGATTTPTLTPNGSNYSFTMPAEAVTITVTTEAVVTYPTVEPEGDDAVITEPLSGNANAAIQSAFADVSASDMPTKLTVIVNGEEYVNNEAIKMINDAVEMFTLTEGAKFFDAQGKLDISFKATGANPEAVAYEAEVGGSTATVNAAYEVVPKYIDIATNTELTAKPEGTVTFRLVIQKKK